MKKIKKASYLIWSIILGTIALLVALHPLLYDQANASLTEAKKAYDENQESYPEDKTNAYPLYSDSTILPKELISYFIPLYGEFLKEQSPNEAMSSLLLKDSEKLTEEAVRSFPQTFDNQRNNISTALNNVHFYIRDTENNHVSTNDDTIKKYFTDKTTEKAVWYMAGTFDKDGKLKVLSNANESALNSASIKYDLLAALENYTYTNEYGETVYYTFKNITNLQFVFEVDEYMGLEITDSQYLGNTPGDTYSTFEERHNITDYYSEATKLVLSLLSILVFLIFFLLPLRHFKESKLYQLLTKIPWEITIIATIIVAFSTIISTGITLYELLEVRYLYPIDFLSTKTWSTIVLWLGLIGLLSIHFLLIALVVFNSKRLPEIGWKNTLKQSSLIYRNLSHIKSKVIQFKNSLLTINLQDKWNKPIFFGILIFASAISILFWFISGQYISFIEISLIFMLSFCFYYKIHTYLIKIKQNFNNLERITSNIAQNDFEIDCSLELGIFEPLRENLMAIQAGFLDAVEQEVTSQKMKTELISNVSHDLKTPLTSIITYIDLLKDPDITQEEREKYLITLDRNSLRLKHLIEDLFEISKVNSGNITLDLMKIDIVSLMKQVQMECETLLNQKQLHIRNNFSDAKIIMLLDSQKTYRIFENLMSNISKYALENTRVYVDIIDYGTVVDISVKNISATELNFSPEEIMERFTRGDKSRNTEGSGLGLAIAKSFTELQNGMITISFDGDLFKVNIRFQKIENDESLKENA